MDKIKYPDDYKYSTDPTKDKEIRNATNLIRLITRIIFIWFLTEKSLIPPELFSREKLGRIVKDFMKGKKASNFYNAILQNLFFGTLNQKMDERKFAQESGFQTNRNEYGVKNLYRYADKFMISKEGVLELFKDIPFLNGGLFDCLDKENGSGKVIYIDGFSRNPAKQSIISDYLFFQQEEERVNLSNYGLGASRPVRGLIEILNSYNFTIDENTLVDQEIALDPELLGKVFENLLASYNPETATTARKATGSYYTPREIVDYMVEESLFEYLKGKLSETEEEKIRMLLSYSEEIPDFSEPVRSKIILAIDNIKILDPACGSGAFPMGILHKLVYALQKLDPKNKYWHELQYQKALKESEEVFKQDDKNERQERLKEINEAFDEGLNYPDYARKLYLIENCIYGVDIQPIAIQISKLRFFISLVLDQKVDRGKENLGIRALPNLETKFVAANTLIGIQMPQHIFYTDKIRNLEDKIKSLRHRYFQARTRREKLDYQKKDRKLRELLAEELKGIGFSSDSSKRIATFDLYDQNASFSWFDPEWMFGQDVKEGLDIIIGNPPYIKEYTYREAFDGVRESQYYQGKMDIWYLFACLSLDILRNDSGILTFIATNNWVTNAGASKMRNKVIRDAQILKMLDFGNYKIFESADIQTMVMIFKNIKRLDDYTFDYRKLCGRETTFTDVLDLLVHADKQQAIYLTPLIKKKALIDRPLTFSDDSKESLLEKIQSKATFKLDEKKEVAQGIVAPQDFLNNAAQRELGAGFAVGEGIFCISNHEKRQLGLGKEERELIKPYFTTSELHKYYGNPKNEYWVIYTDFSFKSQRAIRPYPNLQRHLDRFKSIITSDNAPYGLHRARKENFFKGDKIISLRKCAEPTFTYTDYDCYVSQTFFVIKSLRINMKFLTALLNSQLIAFWLRHKGKMQGHQFQVDKEPLLEIPIIKPEAEQPFITNVDQILAAKKKDPNADTSALEKQIDEMVYALYDLTPEEIAIVEGKG